MAFRTYQTGYGFVTINTDLASGPDSFIAEFPITQDQAEQIDLGAQIEVIDGILVITPVVIEVEE